MSAAEDDRNSSLKKLEAKNKVKVKDQLCQVYLNIPSNFIYDVEDVVVEYNLERKTFTVTCSQLLTKIIHNMEEYKGRDIYSTVRFLEENLECYCSGKKPFFTRQSVVIEEAENKENKKLVPLSASYKIRITDITNPNVHWSCSKTGILICICETMNISVKCTRCGVTNHITAESKKMSFSCIQCREVLESSYISTLSQDYLGFLFLRQCSAISYNPSSFVVTCDACHEYYKTPKIGIKERYLSECFKCYNSLRIYVESVVFITKNHYNIKAGAELPDKGTCKHYKKSYRWFRFPCCQSLYPCDICHDEESGHAHETANKMVCGICSKEQSVKPNCDCGMSLNRKASAFWEGGKGNRNKQIMSRRDSKKYSR